MPLYFVKPWWPCRNYGRSHSFNFLVHSPFCDSWICCRWNKLMAEDNRRFAAVTWDVIFGVGPPAPFCLFCSFVSVLCLAWGKQTSFLDDYFPG